MPSNSRPCLTSAICVPLACLACLTSIGAAEATDSHQQLTIHEWGTFTSASDGNGTQLSRVNRSEEALPQFVYQAMAPNITTPAGSGWFKGPVPLHPAVTMRLETPVLYVHLPDGVQSMDFSVSVDYRSGWLTEWYPKAQATNPGLTNKGPGTLTDSTVGQLVWPKITAKRQMIGFQPGPDTDKKVWLAPRAVDCADLHISGEAERYLFYRGIGRNIAPLQVSIREDTLQVAWIDDSTKEAAKHLPIWLVDVRGKELAYQKISWDENIAWRMDHKDRPGRAALRKDMVAALIADGLYADEAEAMLETWHHSYFTESGLRIFYLVPQSWTDRELPLRISKPAKISRSMIGRLEIMTPSIEQNIKQYHDRDFSKTKGQKAVGFMGSRQFKRPFLMHWQDQHEHPREATIRSISGVHQMRTRDKK